MLNQLLAGFRKDLRAAAKRFKSGVHNPRFDTSDIVQEGMIQIWNEMEATGAENFSVNRSFLNRVIHGNACNLHRFHSAQCRSRNIEQELESDDALADVDDPQRVVEEEENVLRLLDAVSHLKEERQRVFYRRTIDRMTFRAIASEMHVSVEVVRSIYANAVSDLKRILVEA